MVAEMMAQVLYHGYNDQDFHLIQFRLKETIPDVLVFVCLFLKFFSRLPGLFIKEN